MKTNKLLLIVIPSAILSVILGIMDYLLFWQDVNLFSTIGILAAMIFAMPIILIKYLAYRRKRNLEEIFPTFLRDFVGAMRGGMTISESFKTLTKNDYGPLTPYVKKMAAQMDWGIPVEKVLLKFSKSTKSKLIGRVVSSVIESHRFGGNLTDTFEALSNTSLEIEKLRGERSLYLNSQMMTGYIVFFVFLGVIIGLSKFLIPVMTTNNLQGVNIGTASPGTLQIEYKTIFRNLILIQGFFAGLSVGKMTEGALVGGLKHSMIMMTVGAIAFILFG